VKHVGPIVCTGIRASSSDISVISDDLTDSRGISSCQYRSYLREYHLPRQ
jgi:hypothetical protein